MPDWSFDLDKNSDKYNNITVPKEEESGQHEETWEDNTVIEEIEESNTESIVNELPETQSESMYYEEGCKNLDNKQYLEAICNFEKCLTYNDSKDKYKEACYLYGEELLVFGDVQGAEEYFKNAVDYKDAATRIQSFYYEEGETSFNNKDYINASQMYVLAGTYLDSDTKVHECYYQHGIKQMNIGYYDEAIVYLSMCRGYKDTDEILLSHYYSEAEKSVDHLLKEFPSESFTHEIDEAYNSAKSKLLMCEGYKDSNTLLKIVDKLYFVWKEMQYASNFEASLFEMSASYSGDVITITKNGFMSNSDNVVIKYKITNDTFEANMTHLFNMSAREYDIRNVICAMITLFSDISDVSGVDAKLADKSNWDISAEEEMFSMSYGEYSITVKTEPEDYGYINCYINVR